MNICWNLNKTNPQHR